MGAGERQVRSSAAACAGASDLPSCRRALAVRPSGRRAGVRPSAPRIRIAPSVPLALASRPRREPRVLGTDAAACALVAAGAARVERTARLMACTRVPLWALEHLHWRRDDWDRWWVVAGLRGLLQVGTA